jgi:N-acetylglucosamine kinase-like BadF-type ATPase
MMSRGPSARVVVAVDGGASKTDAAIIGVDGRQVLGRHRGPGCSHHEIGPDHAANVIDAAVTAALEESGVHADQVVHAGCYLTAIDLPDEEVLMKDLLSRTGWGARSLIVDNDLFALLRAGTDEADAAVIICGTGINGLAVRKDGTTARIVALGHCSGDWGGGAALVEEALWMAARAEDRRGEPTALREAVLRWSGATSIHEVSVAVHRQLMDVSEWRSNVPEIFALAHQGDRMATELVRRQGREIGILAASLLERLELQNGDVPVVLGGGVAASGDAILLAEARLAMAPRAPRARLIDLATPPIEGAIRLAIASALASS